MENQHQISEWWYRGKSHKQTKNLHTMIIIIFWTYEQLRNNIIQLMIKPRPQIIRFRSSYWHRNGVVPPLNNQRTFHFVRWQCSRPTARWWQRKIALLRWVLKINSMLKWCCWFIFSWICFCAVLFLAQTNYNPSIKYRKEIVFEYLWESVRVR